MKSKNKIELDDLHKLERKIESLEEEFDACAHCYKHNLFDICTNLCERTPREIIEEKIAAQAVLDAMSDEYYINKIKV